MKKMKQFLKLHKISRDTRNRDFWDASRNRLCICRLRKGDEWNWRGNLSGLEEGEGSEEKIWNGKFRRKLIYEIHTLQRHTCCCTSATCVWTSLTTLYKFSALSRPSCRSSVSCAKTSLRMPRMSSRSLLPLSCLLCRAFCDRLHTLRKTRKTYKFWPLSRSIQI